MLVRLVRSGVVVSIADAATLLEPWELLDSPAEGTAERTPEPTEAPDDGAVPKGNASRREWADYAESLGIDPGALTRDELKDAVAAL